MMSKEGGKARGADDGGEALRNHRSIRALPRFREGVLPELTSVHGCLSVLPHASVYLFWRLIPLTIGIITHKHMNRLKNLPCSTDVCSRRIVRPL